MILLDWLKIVATQTCFSDKFPHFISGINADDMEWSGIITNKATDALYLGGYTHTMIPFTGQIGFWL